VKSTGPIAIAPLELPPRTPRPTPAPPVAEPVDPGCEEPERRLWRALLRLAASGGGS
jgi:hypothetical protein